MKSVVITTLLLVGVLLPQPIAGNGTPTGFSFKPAIAQISSQELPEIRLLVSLVWDGKSTEAVSLGAIRTFRQRYTNIPVAHFVSPAYFSATGDKAQMNLRDIVSSARPGDFLGVVLAPWKSLADRSGVIFRNGPTFWGNTVGSKACKDDCGNDVPLNIYPKQDVEKLVAASLDVMKASGFPQIRGMMVRGWMATPEILAVGESSGFRYDFSMVTPSTVYEHLRTFPIFTWVKGLWKKSDILSQPSIVSEDLAGMTAVPQALGALDYVSHEQMKQFLDRMVSASPSTPYTYHVVLHAETAHINLGRLELVLQEVFKQATAGKFRLRMMELPGMEWQIAPPAMVDEKSPHADKPFVH